MWKEIKQRRDTSLNTEVLAGVISYFAIVYIIIVNSTILADAGIPAGAAMVATILTSAAGCFIAGFGANLPLILVPGMGVNAMFTYTFVHSMGLTWQEALGVVFVSGIVFSVIAYTPLLTTLTNAIPSTLKDAITVGLGLFLALIGLEKSHIVVPAEHSLIAFGDITSPEVISFFLTFFIAIILFLRNVPGHFLLTIMIGTVIAWMFGAIDRSQVGMGNVSVGNYADVFLGMSFEAITDVVFWVAVFALTMVLVFENIGLVYGQTKEAEQPEKYKDGIRVVAISATVSGVFGSSPTVSTAEGAAGIAAGGRTGVTAIVMGILFLLSFFLLPFIEVIPASAISPILIIIGFLMVLNIKNINLQDLSEAIPAFLIIMMIPFSYSIADGMVIGFLAYPIAKLALGKGKEVSVPLYVIAGLFLVYFVSQGF